MKINYKSFILGITTGAILMSATGAYAAVGDKVEAMFADFNFFVNGKTVTPSETPLVYNGTSYLPVRSISNLLGYDVTYKADSRTIVLDNGSANVVPTQIPIPTSPVQPQQQLNQLQVLKDYLPKSDSPAISISGKIFIPLRAAMEKYNINAVSYDESKKSVVFDKFNKSVIVSDTQTASELAFIYQGSTYISEDFIKSLVVNQPQPQPTQLPPQEKIYHLNETYRDGSFSLTLTKVNKVGNNLDVTFNYENSSDKSYENLTVALLQYTDPNYNAAPNGGILHFTENNEVTFFYPPNSKGTVHLPLALEYNGTTLHPKYVVAQNPQVKWDVSDLGL